MHQLRHAAADDLRRATGSPAATQMLLSTTFETPSGS
jgi:hypothetical protein